jgi:hypothetical protein
MAQQTSLQSRITIPIATSKIAKASNHKLVDASHNIICLDEDIKEILNFPNEKTLPENGSFAKIPAEPMDISDTNAILLSLDEVDSQPRHEFENQQPLQSHLQTTKNSKTTVRNRKFKCVKCHFRSSWPIFVAKHFKVAHRREAFHHNQCFRVLDEDEATRTLDAYEQKYEKKSLSCKPYKCMKCDYRAAQKCSTYRHLWHVHKVEYHEVMRLVEVLPLDEAKKTVGDYNKKFAFEGGHFCPTLQLETVRYLDS